MSLAGVVSALAIGSSIVSAVVCLARPPRTTVRWTFALGMLGFALESAAGLVLLTTTETSLERTFWLGMLEIGRLATIIPWALFVLALLGTTGWRLAALGAAGASLAAVAGAAILTYEPLFLVSDRPGAFYAAGVVGWGRASALVQLVAALGILAGLEATLRSTRGEERWRTKYLILGLGGVFLGRFYFLSQILLFNVVFASFVASTAGMIALGNAVMAVALMRGVGAGLSVSRQFVYRSGAVGVLGIYLITVGVLAWVLNDLGVPEQVFWGSVVVFVTAVGLAATMLSERLRWRIKRFVATNLYRTKYDYRVQWGNFTRRLGSLVSVEELAPELLSAVLETVGATRGVLYLLDPSRQCYQAAAAAGISRPDGVYGTDAPLPIALKTRSAAASAPLVLGESRPNDGLEPGLVEALGEGALVVPLRWRDELVGFLAVGAERTGHSYGLEDFEFLATLAEQAAGTIATAQLSEKLAQAREFEAFHRITSFVVHDLKNSVSALSMLSENALRNFDDPEFQRDALKTLAKTVDRMKSLMGRLSSAPEAAALRLEPVDLAALVLEAVRPVARSERIALAKELEPVPPVRADADALLRVVQNLVTNAVQAIGDHGTVTLRTFEQDAMAVFSVTDSGCGMSEEFVRTSLFAPFRSTKKGGWGIGLYQAKGIVEAHGGRIEVLSKEGAGTTFSVKLPIERRG